MIMFLFVLLVSVMLGGALLGVAYLLSFSSEGSEDKLSPFECGFNPRESYRSVFSLSFFLISLVFLVFDLELVILFPYLFHQGVIQSPEVYLGSLGFLFILGVGLIYEWCCKSLEWCE